MPKKRKTSPPAQRADGTTSEADTSADNSDIVELRDQAAKLKHQQGENGDVLRDNSEVTRELGQRVEEMLHTTTTNL